ncbi:MAG: hypothetical protein WC804_14835 [Sphingomonas sp.]|uniref:hypothetical protein n=1 Tax=Sphingomonas sp. TaxID=28214 RepID=UPI00356A1113
MIDDLMPMPNSATMTEPPPADAGMAPDSDVGFHDEIDALSPTALGEEGGEPGGTFDDDGVPEAYALTPPEGLTLDAEAIAAATPVFRELGLSNAAANKLMPAAAQFARRVQDQANRQLLSHVQAERKAWLDAARADPEIGGAKWGDTIATAASALDRLGFGKGSAFRNLLDESGLGNHPDMIRAFVKVGRAVAEDNDFVLGGGIPRNRRDRAETLYPHDHPKEGQ